MKTLFLLVTAFSMVVNAQTVEPLVESKTITLSQPITELQLQHQEKEPVFETQEQPDTCYRDVERGTREECHTEYDRSCETRMENECRSVAYPVCNNVQVPVCQTIPRRECHTEPRQQCNTTYENVCHNESNRVCENIPRRECHSQTHQQCTTTNQQVCENQSSQVCTNVPQQVCSTVQECTTVNDQVCKGEGRSRVCTNVPRRQCSPKQQCRTESKQECRTVTKPVCRNVPQQSCKPVTEQVCSTVNDQVCHTQTVPVCQKVPHQSCNTVNESVCTTVNDQVCHTETQQQCHNEYRQDCQVVPREYCQNIPRQACQQVPNIEQEAYACTKKVQVQVGERVKLSILANVKVEIQNFGSVPVNQDSLSVKLIKSAQGNDVQLKLEKSDQKTIYRLVTKELTTQALSDTEQVVSARFVLELVSVDQLNAMKNLKIVETKIFFDKIEFKLQAPGANLPLNQTVLFEKASLNVLMQKRRRVYIVLDESFDPSMKIKKVTDHYEISFADFGVQYLTGYYHTVNLELKLKSLFDRKEVLNPELLDQVSAGSVHGEFEGYPQN